MAKYLIDANLPYYFKLWNNQDYIHVRDLDDTWTDEKIWQYAKENDLIIITKDVDFSTRVLFLGTPPKVIHIKFGNLKMNDFHDLLVKIWPEIEITIEQNNLINIFSDRIEIIK
jgi:predicted nuclease of predicted toxin-antitoxin system